MGKLLEKIIPGYDYRVKKNRLNLDRAVSTGCHQRQNGNMHVGLVPSHDIHLVIPNRNLAIMGGTLIIQAIRGIQSVKRSPILGDCMTCTAMSGNGCRIGGMVITTVHLLMAARGKVEMVPTGSSAVVAGAATPGAVGLLAATSTTPATTMTTSAFSF